MIHYHGTPFSGHEANNLALQGKHACISFANPKSIAAAAELCQSFILDNGAFTAWKSGETLDVEGFEAWAALWSKHPGCDWHLIPDIIDGTEADNNFLILDWELANGVPIWHLHESLEKLEWLCESYRTVALGSSGKYATIGNTLWWGRMAEAMTVACDADGYPKAKLHGLRMLDPRVFSHLPLSSADSTNVARNLGMDNKWTGSYAPASQQMRALIMMERIEAHASSSRWSESHGIQTNYELFG